MLGKKVFAATLATVLGASLFGANAAKAAVINLSSDDKTSPIATYAEETLSAADGDTQKGIADEETYYKVMGFPDVGQTTTTNWMVTSEVGAGLAQNDVVLIRYDFQNMVLTSPPDLSLTGIDTIVLRSGGAIGDNNVVFSGAPSRTIMRGTPLMLALGPDIGISPDAPVSIKVVLTIQGLTDVIPPHETSYRSAITVAKALSASAVSNSLTAAVAHGFKRFTGEEPGTMGSLGTISVKAKEGYQHQNGGGPVGLRDLIMAGNVDDSSGSLLEVMGNLSFASGIALQNIDPEDADSCSTITDGGLLQRDADTMALAPIVVAIPTADEGMDDMPYEKMLCIQVHDPESMEAVAIPATSPYMANLDLAAMGDDRLRSPRDRTLDLGRIMRDGTTVHIPYLTTFEGYNHRITLSNRSGTRAAYEFNFRPEMGVMANPEMDATGWLAAGQTRVLRAQNVVTLIGGSRTAATVTVVAQPTDIDVSSTLINMNTGGAVITVHLSDNGLR